MTDALAADLSPAELALRAEAGDADAQLHYARYLVANGKGAESFDWLVKAARDGHPVAATELGMRLVVGITAPHDVEAGVKWIDAAARSGFPEGLRWRALMYAAGIGEPPNFGAALNLLEMAAMAGEPPATAQMATLHACGITNDATLTEFLNPPAPLLFSESPWVVAAEHILPAPMCQWWIARAANQLEQARVHDAAAGGRRVDSIRTNSGTGFGLLQTDIIMQLSLARIAAAVGRPRRWQEAPNVLHYAPGEKYDLHYDFLDPENPAFREDLARHGQRRTTALVYLNQDFMEGQTWFEAIQKTARTPQGGMIAFDNVLGDGSPDKRSLHAGLPTTLGEKWLLSVWIRDRNQPIL